MKYKIVATLAFTMLFSSCGFFNQEDPLEKERKEIEEITESTIVEYYKSTKILVKSIPADLKKLENDATRENAGKLRLLVLVLGLKTTEAALVPDSLSTADIVELYATYAAMRETMSQLDEDDLPPLLPTLTYIATQTATLTVMVAAVSSGGHLVGIGELIQGLNRDFFLPDWTNNDEHTLLAALMASKISPAPSSCMVYEAYKIDVSSFAPNEYKTLGTWVKAMVYQQKEWNYTSEKLLTEALKDLKEGHIEPKENLSFLTLKRGAGKQAMLDDLTATTHLLRGVTRTTMDEEEKKKLGISDFNSFLDHAQKIGLDNELIWLLEVYLSLEEGNLEKANAGLKKLRSSKWIGQSEKDVIDQTTEYLNERDPESAFNYFSDKTFMASVISKYAFEHFKKTKAYAEIANSNGGQLLLDFPSLFTSTYKDIVPVDKVEDVKDKVLNILQ